jgi:hypothetical protein
VGYSVLRIDEVEGAGPDGAVKFLRRELGVQAFHGNGSYEARGPF